jgi:hypothetical protein
MSAIETQPPCSGQRAAETIKQGHVSGCFASEYALQYVRRLQCFAILGLPYQGQGQLRLKVGDARLVLAALAL